MLYKWVFDFVFSFFGLLLLSPCFLIIVILILVLMPGGPVIFRHKRIGRYGKSFILLKFRSMHSNINGSSITVLGDSRITPLGKVLRKYKLDELPGLWNVLIGDMSIVGPRPDVPGYADLLTGDYRRILEMRPGLTCLASLKYRNEEEILANHEDPIKYNNEVIYPDKVKINLQYVKSWTFWSDIKIIFNTIWLKKN